MGSREIWDYTYRLFRAGISVIQNTVKEGSVYERATLYVSRATLYASRATLATVLEIKNVGTCLHSASASRGINEMI